MKKTILLFLGPAVLLFLSCVDNVSTFPEESDGVFYGILTVGDYTEEAGISVTENPDATVDLFFDNVKFAKAMPVRIDITVKGVSSNKSEDVLAFSATDIDPYVNREQEPQPAYSFAEISGTVKGKELVLSAKMADDLKPSRAGKKFSFKGLCN